jgi:1-acyl-sn-glycerol-3-phosphate acyltransferase
MPGSRTPTDRTPTDRTPTDRIAADDGTFGGGRGLRSAQADRRVATSPVRAAQSSRRGLYLLTRMLLAPLARLVYRPVIEGRDNVPQHGPVILASNHLSFIDSIVIPLVAPRPVVFLTKAEYFQGRGIRGTLTRWFVTALSCVPVQRGNYGAAQASLDAALRVLESGDAFGIYPEGTRSRDGRLHRGRTGVAWLALTARVPVVPVALAGTEQIQPLGARLPRIRRITVRFGAALEFGPEFGEAGSARARRDVTDQIVSAIGELSKQEYSGVYHALDPN